MTRFTSKIEINPMSSVLKCCCKLDDCLSLGAKFFNQGSFFGFVSVRISTFLYGFLQYVGTKRSNSIERPASRGFHVWEPAVNFWSETMANGSTATFVGAHWAS